MRAAGHAVRARLGRRDDSKSKRFPHSLPTLLLQTVCGAYLFRERTVVSLGDVLPHGFSHRFDLFAEGNTRRRRRLDGILQAVAVFILIHTRKKQNRGR